MKRVTQFMALAIFAFATSCADQTTVFNDPQDEIILENSLSNLESSVQYDNAGVLDIYEAATINGKSNKTAIDLAGDYPLTLVAQIAAPSREGSQLTASHVAIEGNYAYVAYNTVEDGFSGAIDIIRISDPNNPVITGRLFYLNVDVNTIAYDNGFIFVAGGVDSELSTRATSNSLIARLATSGGTFNLNAGIDYAFQMGFNATDIKVIGNSILVGSGKDGALGFYNKNDLAPISEAPFFDIRAIALNGSEIAILDASKGVSFLSQDLQITQEIPIDCDFGVATKRTLDFFGDNIAVSEGPDGAGLYNASTGSYVKHIPIMTSPNGVDTSDIVTNGVAANENLLFIANGGGGLSLAEIRNGSTEVVGVLELEGSINYVQSRGDYLFAAAGKGGFQIIKLNRPSETLVNICANSPSYNGSRNLNVNTGEELAYSGSKRFTSLNIDGSLLLCGSWTVRDQVDINANALFEMNGTFVVARNNRRRDLTVDNGATFRIEGNLTIYGDLILNDGATIEFLGEDSVVNIFGSVIRNGNTTVSGNFRDIRSKF